MAHGSMHLLTLLVRAQVQYSMICLHGQQVSCWLLGTVALFVLSFFWSYPMRWCTWTPLKANACCNYNSGLLNRIMLYPPASPSQHSVVLRTHMSDIPKWTYLSNCFSGYRAATAKYCYFFTIDRHIGQESIQCQSSITLHIKTNKQTVQTAA